MSKFEIIQKDPILYKEEILRFWEEYLPGTPEKRFEWMNQGNPAGQTIWFFALERESGELAGTISIMPREITLDGRTLRAGILGDFMVNKKYRLFGPTLELPKIAVTNLKNLGFEFIYTIPNAASRKVLQRVGFKDIGSLCYLKKPLEVKYFLEKYMNPFLVRITAPAIEEILRILSRELYITAGGFFEEVYEAKPAFDLLWDMIKTNQTGGLGNRNSAYLNWRYFRNPLYRFRVVTYREKEAGSLLGYIFFGVRDDSIEIFDIIATRKHCGDKLLKRLINLAREESCSAIYIQVSKKSPWLRKLKAYLFFDTKYDMEIYFVGDDWLIPKVQQFLGGDRNI